MTFKGLTWDHPRGYDALAEAARRVNQGRDSALIHWDKQPLEGFESAPIADLASRYDLLVLDHPHIGEAVAENCLIPLEEFFGADVINSWAAQSIGPSLKSYSWGGKTWAVPLDVATQVMARRPDLVPDAPLTWDAVARLSMAQPVALSLGGPHAWLNLISFAAGQRAVIGGDQMLPDEVALNALYRLGEIARRAPPGTETLNPIQLLNAMGQSDEIALIPLIFGYVTYAREGHTPMPVKFSNSIRTGDGFGAVLGGTGIGISRRAVPSQELLDHIAWLMTPDVQRDLFPAFGGQPSARQAWQDQTVNRDWNAFYRDTGDTAENALLRPRFDGYIAFQTAASALIKDAFRNKTDETQTLHDLRQLWQAARETARGGLDDERMVND